MTVAIAVPVVSLVSYTREFTDNKKRLPGAGDVKMDRYTYVLSKSERRKYQKYVKKIIETDQVLPESIIPKTPKDMKKHCLPLYDWPEYELAPTYVNYWFHFNVNHDIVVGVKVDR